MNIPLLDLKAQYRALKIEIDAAVTSVMEECNFILGDAVRQLEQEFADFTGVRHVIGVGSGTSALYLALKVLDIGPSDEVITVANTFVSSLLAISQTGATPVLVDCNPKSYNIDVSQIESKISPRTKAILPVHLYGQTADMNPLLEISSRHGLKVVEDACQAHGATYKGRKAGSMGDLGCFSFYPGKNLGAYGDGGAIATNDSEYADKLVFWRNWGSKIKYHHEVKGVNSRLDTMQAAILRVKLRHLDEWNQLRRQHAALYTELLNGTDVVTPKVMPYGEHIFHLYVVRIKDRDATLEALHKAGVGAGIHYPIPVHLLGAYRDLGHRSGDFPEAERAAREIVSLPIFPELTDEQIRYCVRALLESPL